MQILSWYLHLSFKIGIFSRLLGVVSSAGRATGLHPVGQRFEPVTTHHPMLFELRVAYATRNRLELGVSPEAKGVGGANEA